MTRPKLVSNVEVRSPSFASPGSLTKDVFPVVSRVPGEGGRPAGDLQGHPASAGRGRPGVSRIAMLSTRTQAGNRSCAHLRVPETRRSTTATP